MSSRVECMQCKCILMSPKKGKREVWLVNKEWQEKKYTTYRCLHRSPWQIYVPNLGKVRLKGWWSEWCWAPYNAIGDACASRIMIWSFVVVDNKQIVPIATNWLNMTRSLFGLVCRGRCEYPMDPRPTRRSWNIFQATCASHYIPSYISTHIPFRIEPSITFSTSVPTGSTHIVADQLVPHTSNSDSVAKHSNWWSPGWRNPKLTLTVAAKCRIWDR